MNEKKHDVSFLLDVFEKYMDIARNCEKKGNYINATKNYYLAANSLVKIIDNTPEGKLKEARKEKAKAIITHADSLPKSNSIVYPTKNASQQSSAEAQDEDEKQWEAAEIPNVHFSDVIGLEDVKREITLKMINPIKYPEKYKYYNKRTGGGVILYGPPGTGKTMIAKAIACEVGAKFYAVKSSDIVSKWVGDSEKNIASLFKAANKQDRAIIFIDEMDSLFRKRGEDQNNDKRVNEFLQQIDGFASKNENLLVLGATNRPWDIDDAAKRSGRFSEKIYIHLPDKEARKGLFQLYLKDVPVANDCNLDEFVEMTKGFSGADIMETVEKAKERPLSNYISTNQAEPISRYDFVRAIKHVASFLDNSDLQKYEKYANRNNSLIEDIDEGEPTQNVAKVNENVVTKQENTLEIEFLQTEFNFVPDQKIVLEFYCNGNFDQLFINVDSKNLVCTKKIHNYISSEFSINEPGTYKVTILDGNGKIISDKTEIKILPPLMENDLGL